MGNTLCCSKQPDRDMRNKLIIGHVDTDPPITLTQCKMAEPTIYDNVWTDTDRSHTLL